MAWKIKWFAKSSGTTNDKSKFIPVSNEALSFNHFKAGKDLLSVYLNNYPNSKIFKGRSLAIGGSRQISALDNNIFTGDISAVLIKNLPIWARFFRTPPMKIALMSEWENKFEQNGCYYFKTKYNKHFWRPNMDNCFNKKNLGIK